MWTDTANNCLVHGDFLKNVFIVVTCNWKKRNLWMPVDHDFVFWGRGGKLEVGYLGIWILMSFVGQQNSSTYGKSQKSGRGGGYHPYNRWRNL